MSDTNGRSRQERGIAQIDSCPECGVGIRWLATRGPGDVRAYPCGCRITAPPSSVSGVDTPEREETEDERQLVADGGVEEELIGGRFERVEDGRGTAYTVGLVRLDADRFPALDDVGYSQATLYVLFTDGRVLGADHDKHRLARDVGESWLVEAIEEIEDEEVSP